MKSQFFVNLCYFIIKEKTINVGENLLDISKLDNDLILEIYECTNFNVLVDIASNFLNKKFNLNLDIEFYRLLKN